MTLVEGAGTVRIAVADVEPGGALPARLPQGLGVVSQLARDWGVVRRPSGKELWAELDCDRASGYA